MRWVMDNNYTIRNLMALGGNQLPWCISVEPVYEFKDGHYTKQVVGQQYNCLLPGNEFQKLSIKTKEIIPTISNEIIRNSGGKVTINVDDFTCKFYVDKTNRLKMSCWANSVYPVTEGGDQNETIIE